MMKKNLIEITSPSNPRIKDVARLRKREHRDEGGVFGVEGAREIGHALAGGFRPREYFVVEADLSAAGREILGKLDGVLGHAASPAAFEKIAMREGSDGLFVVFEQKRLTLRDLKLPAGALVLAVEGVEKPGNLGALLRTADGAGVDAVVVLDGTVDIFNPNAIRASLGTIFRLPIVVCALNEFRETFLAQGFQLVAASPHATKFYHEVDYRKPTAVVVGSEAEGLTSAWNDETSCFVKIPMQGGRADSLNVSVAGAVVLYEACRQRLILPRI